MTAGRQVVAAVIAGACVLSVTTLMATNEARAEEPKSSRSICMIVMDPLAKELACDCVAGFAQRRYEALAMVLQRRLDRPCSTICGTNLAAYWNEEDRVDLIVGKHSEVLAAAKKLKRKVYPLASLTNLQGETTFQGLFVVREGSAARSIQDLAGHRILLGPDKCDEKHAAALAALRKANVQGFDKASAETCTDAANQLLELNDDDKVAAVISDYARVLLEGCHTIPKGSLRVIGKTAPLPFITVFATEDMQADLRNDVRRELLAARKFAALLQLLETKNGFQPFKTKETGQEPATGWLDFRGPGRRGLVPALPESLDAMRTLWSASLSDNGLGGVAATERWVLVTDRDPVTGLDLLKVFDINTGKLASQTRLMRPPKAEPDPKLDYGDSIRAFPLIDGSRVLVVDAFGTLFACPLPEPGVSGQETIAAGMRMESLIDQYQLATWGVASTPLLAGDRLVVSVCGEATSLVTLDLDSLDSVWKGPGRGTGYASCIAGTFGGRRQILGYQSESFSGWDLDTGSLLWNVRPEFEGDYNVPTPIAVDDRHILLATENNGTRLYEFNRQGILQADPIAVNEDVAPDTVTPVAVGGFAYCTSADALFRLNLNDGLSSDWSLEDDVFRDHVSLIADEHGRRLLVVTYSGELLLFDISGAGPQLKSRQTPAGLASEEEIYSHPAIVGDRLYLRGIRSLNCVVF